MIIAFTGAGVSKASGIPTFDEMGDLRLKLDRGFATKYPDEFQKVMNFITNACRNAEPNDAHKALAEYNIPVITMNIDSLHSRAGSQNVLELHGSIKDNNVVLYGDQAPNYSKTYWWLDRLRENDVFLIIGTSFFTNISEQIHEAAIKSGAKVIIINEDAEHKVRETLEKYQHCIEKFDDFYNREPYWLEN